MTMQRYEGRCHCGNLSYVFNASRSLTELGLRACQCSFCRAHAARTTSDPYGAVHIAARDPAKLNRYRFGLKTADFLICRECGLYIGAMMEEGGRRWITVNVNTLLTPPGPDAPIVAHEFGAEDLDSRVARRKLKWTPVAEFPE